MLSGPSGCTGAPTDRSQMVAFIVGELEAIDKHQGAVIESDRPSAACIGNVLAADVDAIAGAFMRRPVRVPENRHQVVVEPRVLDLAGGP